jgi:hypothetical protein
VASSKPTYWLDLFTGPTWQEFQAAGSKVTGFREHNWKRARHIKPGDIFLCYLVGVKLWVGLLEVTGPRYRDDTAIWKEETFPVRFQVKPLVLLPPEHGVPMESLCGKVSFFPEGSTSAQWSGYVRSSPTKYSVTDGQVIAAAVREAEAHPVLQKVDPKKLVRSANLYQVKSKAGNEEIEAVVSVPTKEEEAAEEAQQEAPVGAAPDHTEIQWRLLYLGSQMGLKVWAPMSDRGKVWKAHQIGDVPNLLQSLPTQFNKGAQRTVENIDVLWVSGETIVAAFEVEHTTSVYSGLLRMSDLVTMVPNLEVQFYLVAPDSRYEKFCTEVARPTFSFRKKPLHSMCRFLRYSKLCDQLEKARDVIAYLRPEFLDKIAESFDPAAEIGV